MDGFDSVLCCIATRGTTAVSMIPVVGMAVGNSIMYGF